MQLSYTAVQKHFGELVILRAGEKWKSWTIARMSGMIVDKLVKKGLSNFTFMSHPRYCI